jgi:hypothetical protein
VALCHAQGRPRTMPLSRSTLCGCCHASGGSWQAQAERLGQRQTQAGVRMYMCLRVCVCVCWPLSNGRERLCDCESERMQRPNRQWVSVCVCVCPCVYVYMCVSSYVCMTIGQHYITRSGGLLDAGQARGHCLSLCRPVTRGYGNGARTHRER